MLDMFKMMGKIKEVQDKMKEAHASLQQITADGESGAGLVKATVNGHKEVIGLHIDPSLINPQDADMMKDLTIAAVNKAIANVDDLVKAHMKKATEGLIPNIPGLDLSNLA